MSNRRAKIICTIGPATETKEMIGALLDAGMNVARLNFSHSDHETHLNRLQMLRSVAAEKKVSLAILMDLQGPKIRVGKVGPKYQKLTAGQKVSFTTEAAKESEDFLYISYPNLLNDLKVGAELLIDDGKLKLVVREIKDPHFVAEVIYGGPLSDRKGVNFSNVKSSLPCLTEKDLKDVQFAIKNPVDYIALSFVKEASDVLQLKKILADHKVDTPVISKIEKHEAIENLEDIIKVSDGILIARGDLGVEISPERVPVLQKKIIERSNLAGKVVITATQMLESMITSSIPTRAEATNVANAVFDGTDAVMLSAETASGQFPIDSVKMMDRIVREAESYPKYINNQLVHTHVENLTIPQTISHACWLSAQHIKAKTIVVLTQSGGSALSISKYKPSSELACLTPNVNVYNRMALYWGVTPIIMQEEQDSDEAFKHVEQLLLKDKHVKAGDLTILIAGTPVRRKGATNNLRIHRVGDPL
jgi:pyruvate kinase